MSWLHALYPPVHVFLKEQLSISGQYICLSYRWGSTGPAVRLTASTVGLLRQGLLISDLPNTFRDAVEVCRHVAVRYL
jgi:hypothetical protein